MDDFSHFWPSVRRGCAATALVCTRRCYEQSRRWTKSLNSVTKKIRVAYMKLINNKRLYTLI